MYKECNNFSNICSKIFQKEARLRVKKSVQMCGKKVKVIVPFHMAHYPGLQRVLLLFSVVLLLLLLAVLKEINLNTLTIKTTIKMLDILKLCLYVRFLSENIYRENNRNNSIALPKLIIKLRFDGNKSS